MASYSIVTTALALGVPRKKVENLLLRRIVPGTGPGRQGRTRRLNREVVVFLAAVIQLQDRLGVPCTVACSLLPTSLQELNGAHLVVLGPISLAVDFAVLSAEVSAALGAAVEMAPRPRRGRPSDKEAHP